MSYAIGEKRIKLETFVNNIDDFNYEDNFGDYVVSKELLEKLLKTIDEVLNNHSKAAELLPTSEGFFW